jgi:hypothetical protein
LVCVFSIIIGLFVIIYIYIYIYIGIYFKTLFQIVKIKLVHNGLWNYFEMFQGFWNLKFVNYEKKKCITKHWFNVSFTLQEYLI